MQHIVHLPRFGALSALATVFFIGSAEAQAGNCFPECRTGYACSPANECVSICNPPCQDGQLCTAEATCVADPAAAQPVAVQPAPVQPVQQAYAPPPQQHYSQAQYPVPPPAQTPAPSAIARPGSFRLSVSAHLGFGGEASVNFDGDEVGANDLAPTFGVAVRGLAALGDYVLLGPAFSYRSYKLDVPASAPDPDRTGFIGVGAAFGAHYGIDLGSIAIDPYFLVSLGLAIGLANSDVGIDDSEFGVDFAIRAGTYLWFSELVGATVSLGYQRADLFLEVAGASESARQTVGQFALELGLSLRLGS